MTTRTARPLHRRCMAVLGLTILVGLADGPSGAISQDFPQLPDPAPSKAAPPEVKAFVKRLAGCHRWAGEEATDAERGAAIAQARFRLRCSTIDQDESRLRARFATSPSALEAIDQADSGDE